MSQKELKQRLQDRILENPYDLDRENAVRVMRKSVPFLANLDSRTLRYLYMRAKQKNYHYNDLLFKIGQNCKALQILVQGTIEIGLSDGENYQ